MFFRHLTDFLYADVKLTKHLLLKHSPKVINSGYLSHCIFVTPNRTIYSRSLTIGKINKAVNSGKINFT